MFVRMANCNLECKWCDTAYTWAFTDDKAARTESGRKYNKFEEIKNMNTEDVISILMSQWNMAIPTMIVFSGGEPLMQAAQLEDLAVELGSMGHEVHFETAGTIIPTEKLNYHVTQYNVSPKLKHSGNLLGKRYKPDVLRWFADNDKSWFKFVVRNRSDFNEIDTIVGECSIPDDRVMVMPEGTTAADISDGASSIVDKALERGWGLSLRQHVILWGDERKR
jgi:7-carboxy-7-deazaguanine synthase